MAVRVHISRRGLQSCCIYLDQQAVHAMHMVGVTNGCGHSLDQQSSVKFWLIKRSKGASKQDQAIKSKIWRSKILIAVADGSTGYIAVTMAMKISPLYEASNDDFKP